MALGKNFNEFNWHLTNRIPDPILFPIASAYFPEKLNLKVIENVLDASNAFERLSYFKFGVAKRDETEFEYEDDIWFSTIKSHDSMYESKPFRIPRDTYHFINLKIPNDGYIFHPKNETNRESLEKNEETEAFIKRLIGNVQKLNLFTEQPSFRFDYSVKNGRMAFYFYDVGKKNILTIKTEYGKPIGKPGNGSLNAWAGMWNN